MKINQSPPPPAIKFIYDACIIGVGRIGLPLSLSLIENGYKVIGIDSNIETIKSINEGKIPFIEPGYDELINSKKLEVFSDYNLVSKCKSIIITVGTPLNNHIESDLIQVTNAINDISKFLVKDQLLVLRSTVAPKTTFYVKKLLEMNISLKIGENFGLAFCPERISGGHAKEELKSLPQIVGVEDDYSFNLAHNLWKKINSNILKTNFIQAELIKLFNNTTRYVEFALANQFALISEQLGASIFEIKELANKDYPRNKFSDPGFTAGSCLRKDFGMINETQPYADILLSAWKINEYMPYFLVETISKKIEIHKKKVTILGFTFKKDTDDTRDSLVPKLYRYIERMVPYEIKINDIYLSSTIEEGNYKYRNYKLDECLYNCEIIFVATCHTGYLDALKNAAKSNPNCWVIDIWNITNINKMVFQLHEIIDF